ncbi:glycosyltransferase family 2 protein [Liquorilactobacillus sicerae]|uniref:glycosyltransferase family 2 protein n=1 Tax=Liquorilactobacillus sicerae TaxID=1416943 RepID=UPI002480F599|nr:glycosyltransferase family 2 protein [Liquorilactobacillus sicerae]
MKISVAIATYNGEHFIERQLESIKCQTQLPDEVIICDDCSQDGTVEIVKNYIRKSKLLNWKIEINRTNLGYKKNFFQLLTKVTGDLIFLSDQDDHWKPNKIEVMAKTIQQNPSLGTLNSAISLIDQNSQPVEVALKPNFYNANFLHSTKPLQNLNFFGLDNILQRNISPGCSMCITRKICDDFILLYDYSLPHDWFLNLLSSIDNGCGFLNEPLIDYRIHSQNTLGLSVDPGSAGKIKIFENLRKSKINEFSNLIEAFGTISQYFSLSESRKKHINDYLHARRGFYQQQNLRALIQLRRFPEYYQTATFKGRLWDLLIAIHLKNFFYKVMKHI